MHKTATTQMKRKLSKHMVTITGTLLCGFISKFSLILGSTVVIVGSTVVKTETVCLGRVEFCRDVSISLSNDNDVHFAATVDLTFGTSLSSEFIHPIIRPKLNLS